MNARLKIDPTIRQLLLDVDPSVLGSFLLTALDLENDRDPSRSQYASKPIDEARRRALRLQLRAGSRGAPVEDYVSVGAEFCLGDDWVIEYQFHDVHEPLTSFVIRHLNSVERHIVGDGCNDRVVWRNLP